MKPSQFSAHGLPGALTRASPLHLTSHALSRALERLGCNTVAEAEEVLRSPTIARAAAFGAPFVRLPSGHRVVLIGNRVVTVLPKNYSMGCLAPARDPSHGRAA